MGFLHSITVNAMKERCNIRKCPKGRFGPGEMKNTSMPGNRGEKKLKNTPTIGKCL